MENGCCLGLDKITDAGERVEFLKNTPALYRNMVKNIEKFTYPNPALTIANFLIEERKKRDGLN